MRRPDADELREWQATAAKRKAVLPAKMGVKGRDVGIVCGSCNTAFERKLLPNRNDPVYVCPGCGTRNYVPIQL